MEREYEALLLALKENSSANNVLRDQIKTLSLDVNNLKIAVAQFATSITEMSQNVTGVIARVGDLEVGKQIEQAVKQDRAVRGNEPETGGALSALLRNPTAMIVVAVLALCFTAITIFAIARDPSAANRVVDKVPTQQESK